MSITGRLFGFALVGPIGAVGPTAASKRAKAQKKLLEEQATQSGGWPTPWTAAHPGRPRRGRSIATSR